MEESFCSDEYSSDLSEGDAEVAKEDFVSEESSEAEEDYFFEDD